MALVLVLAVWGLAALLMALRRSRLEAVAMLLPMALGGLSVLDLLQVALFEPLTAGAFSQEGVAFQISPRIIMPVIYLVILITYIDEGTLRSALLIPGLALTAFFGGVFVPFFVNAGVAMNALVFSDWVRLSFWLTLRQQLAELATMVLAIYVLIVVYQLLANRLPEGRLWLAGAAALAVAGVTHAAIFSLAGYGGLGVWRTVLLSELAGWGIAGVALWPVLGLELVWQRKLAAAEGRPLQHARPALDLVQESLALQGALKRARREAQRVARNLALLMELRALLQQTPDPQQSLQQICAGLVEGGPYEVAWIDLRLCKGWRTGRVVMVGEEPQGEDWAQAAGAVQRAGGEALNARAFIQRLRRSSIGQADRGIATMMAFPLEVKDQVEGTLYVVAPRGEVDEQEVRILAGVADDIAHTLVRHSLEVQRARRSAELRVIGELTSQMVQPERTSDLLEDILGRCAALLECDRAWMRLPGKVDAEGEIIRWVANPAQQPEPTPPAALAAASQAADRQPGQYVEQGVVWTAAPLRSQQLKAGLMAVGRPQAKGDFEPADLELLDLFANYASMAFEQRQLKRAMEGRARDLAQLNVLTREALSLRRPQEMAATLAQAIRELLHAADCRIALRSDESAGKVEDLVIEPQEGGNDLLQLAARLWDRVDPQGGPLRVERDEPAFPASLRAAGVKTIVAMPIRTGEACLGLALVMDPVEMDHNAERWTLGAQALDSFSLALANARAIERERNRARAMEALREASLQLTSSLSLGPVLDTILEQTLSLIEADDAHIFLYENGVLRFGAARYQGGSREGHIFTQVRQDGLTYTVARTGERIVIPDVNKHPLYRNWKWGGAIIGLPLKVGNQVLGVMNVALARPHSFSQQELETLQLLADQAAIALQNARLFEHLEAERRRIHMLFEIARVTAQSLNEQEILQVGLERVTEVIGAVLGEAFLYSPSEGGLVLSAVAGKLAIEPGQMDSLLALKKGRGLEGWVAQTREPALVDNVFEDPRWLRLPDWDSSLRCAICAPMLAGEEMLGVITLVADRRFEPDQLDLLMAAASQMALGLANARRYQELERRVQELSTIQHLLQIINRRVEMKALLHEVVNQVRDQLGYGTVRVFLVEGDQLIEGASSGVQKDEGSAAPVSSAVRQALERGEACFGCPVAGEEEQPAEKGKTEIAVPLVKGDIVIGVLDVQTAPDHPLTHDDLNLLRLLADQVSIAVENASLYERLRQHMMELEQTVAERTAALSAALEKAQEADRLKTQFVADVSHELRTPLTNIRLYLELLHYGNPERFPEYLETLERETGRLVDLIEDLLAISRLDAGTISPNRVPLNLNNLARGLVEDRSRLFAEKQLEVHFEPAPHLPYVSGDERMLSQVIANILTNALHYTHPGGSIVVRTQLEQTQDGEWVTLAVRDTGIGIPPSEQPHVFERFFRGAASRDLGVPGTGLGLAICKEIMDRHDGRITMQSEFRKGSTFTLWLPPLGKDQAPHSATELPEGGTPEDLL